MSLLPESHGWMGKALDRLDAADKGSRREMVLQTVLGLSLMFSQGISSRARTALTRATELAENVQDHQLRAFASLSLSCIRLEDFRGALALGRRAEEGAKGSDDPVAASTANSLIATPLFFLGEYGEALTRARRVHRHVVPAAQHAHIAHHSIWARCIVAQALWLQGLIDQSAQAARDVLADAPRVGGRAVSMCIALIWCGCNISLRLGDLQTAERSIAQLKYNAEKHDLSSHYACGLGYEGQLSAKRGDIARGEQLLRACLVGLREAKYELHYTPFLSSLAKVLAMMGRFDESLSLADEALQRAQRTDDSGGCPKRCGSKAKS